MPGIATVPPECSAPWLSCGTSPGCQALPHLTPWGAPTTSDNLPHCDYCIFAGEDNTVVVSLGNLLTQHIMLKEDESVHLGIHEDTGEATTPPEKEVRYWGVIYCITV